MEEKITAIIFSRLPGKAGSSPEITKMIPKNFDVPEEEVLQKTLPFGGKLNEFFDKIIKENKILVYFFKIDNIEHRPDLASIGIIYKKEANKFMLRDAMIDLFAFLQENNILSVKMLKNNLSTIMKSLNSNSKIEIKVLEKKKTKKYVFDYPKYIKKRGYTILQKYDSFFDDI